MPGSTDIYTHLRKDGYVTSCYCVYTTLPNIRPQCLQPHEFFLMAQESTPPNDFLSLRSPAWVYSIKLASSPCLVTLGWIFPAAWQPMLNPVIFLLSLVIQQALKPREGPNSTGEGHSDVSIICDCPQSQLVHRVSHQIHPGSLPQAPLCFSERKEMLRKNSLNHLKRCSPCFYLPILMAEEILQLLRLGLFLKSLGFPILWNCKNEALLSVSTMSFKDVVHCLEQTSTHCHP